MTADPPDTFRFPVHLPGPVDVPESLELFRRWGDDLVDRWDGSTLVRTVRHEERTIAFAAQWNGSNGTPGFLVAVNDAADRAVVEAEVARTFVPRPPEFESFLQRDPLIAQLDDLYPGLRPVRQRDLLHALVRHVSAQQVNLRWAVTTRRRLAQAIGDRHEVGGFEVYTLNPDQLASASFRTIRDLQFTTRKAETLVEIGVRMKSGDLNLAELEFLDDEEVMTRLVSIRGVGAWTAEWVLARSLDRPRVVAGDLAVRKAVGLTYLGKSLASEREVRAVTAHWGSSGLHAQALLLHTFSNGTLAALPHKSEIMKPGPKSGIL